MYIYIDIYIYTYIYIYRDIYIYIYIYIGIYRYIYIDIFQTEWILNPSVVRGSKCYLGSKGDKGQQSFKMVVFHVPDDRALVLDGLAFDLRGWNIYGTHQQILFRVC